MDLKEKATILPYYRNRPKHLYKGTSLVLAACRT